MSKKLIIENGKLYCPYCYPKETTFSGSVSGYIDIEWNSKTKEFDEASNCEWETLDSIICDEEDCDGEWEPPYDTEERD